MADIERIAGMLQLLKARAQQIYPNAYPLMHFSVYDDGDCRFVIFSLGIGISNIEGEGRSVEEAYANACALLDERDPELIGRTLGIVTA